MSVCCCAIEKPEDPFIPEPEPLGFFPPLDRKRPAYPFVADETHRLPAADGFIPNSVLVRLLFPEKMRSDDIVDKYEPPETIAVPTEYVDQLNEVVQCYLQCLPLVI